MNVVVKVLRVTLTGGVGAAVAASVAMAAPNGPPAPNGPDSKRPMLAEVPSSVTKAFGAFARERQPADSPPWLVQLLSDGPPNWLGVNPALARRVGIAGDMWLVPGTNSMCLIAKGSRSAGGSCPDDLSTVTSRGIVMSGNEGVRGAMPDGVAGVTLIRAKAARRTVKVRRNAFKSQTRRVKRVSFTLRGRAVSVPVRPMQ